MDEITIRGTRKQANLQVWSQRVPECREGGMPVTQWCESNGFSRKTYYRWQKKIFEAMAEEPAGGAQVRGGHSPTARERRRCHGAHRFRRGGCGCVHGSRRGDRGGYREGADGMLNDFNCSCPVYIACGYTDLRRGIDGLAGLVKSEFDLDPFQEALFLFCGRRRDRIKALYWEGNGFVLLYKRLEQGVYQWPRTDAEVRRITPQQYRWLMEGLKVEQPKAHRPVTGLSII